VGQPTNLAEEKEITPIPQKKNEKAKIPNRK
jgi:hypothetical protein